MTRTFNGQSNNSWGLAIENAPTERFDARVDGPGIDSADGSLVVDGNWKHLALVWDSSTETFTSYVNGVEAASGTTTTDANFGEPGDRWFRKAARGTSATMTAAVAIVTSMARSMRSLSGIAH